MRTLPSDLVQALTDRGERLTVLVVRLGALGDILRTLPPVRLLRSALDRARLFWVADDRWSGVLQGHGDLDDVLALPRREWPRSPLRPAEWPRAWRALSSFRRRLRGLEADLAIDFHGNLRSGWICRWSGAGVRLGYEGHQQKELNRWFTTHRVASGNRRTPRMERNLDLIRALGLPDHPLPDAGLPLLDSGAARAAQIIDDLCGPSAAFGPISPGASSAQAHKKPPAALLAAAARAMNRRGIMPLVVWGPGEEQEARRVVAQPETGARLAPATDLATLAALLERARVFVGGDSGPLHLACAVGCPVVGLYGPTDPCVNAPWGVDSRSVFPPDRTYTGIKRLDRTAGFEGLVPAQVETAVEELLDARRSATPA